MILNRMANALKSQDWTTVFVEFLLVVLGVLVALEVDRYNERLKERSEEVGFLRALERDIERDIDELTLLMQGFSTVESFGHQSITTLGGEKCNGGECWSRLVELFHASQWIDVSLNSTTFEEMKRLGLPSDPFLKDTLEQYYALGRSRKILTQDLPEYRRLVRSIIPPDMQRYIWRNCFSVEGKFETYRTDCEAPVPEDASRQVVRQLQQSPEVTKALTFWLSNLSLTTVTLPKQITDAEKLLGVLRSAGGR